MSARLATWLVTPDGTRLAIKPTGILVGRAPHCDVILSEPGASRVQAIVFAGADGPCLAVLGKGPTAVNGAPVVHDRELAAGDRIELPGFTLEVLAGPEEATPPPPRSSWVLRGPSGLFGVVRTPFTVGSGADADLRLDGGPEVALRFHLADRLHVEAVAAISIDGVACEPGAVEELRPGTIVGYPGGLFEVVSANPQSLASTENPADTGDPTEVRLEFLARGGRLTVGWPGHHRAVYLPERRCDLVAALLQPPAPLNPGDFVPDDVILPRIWPGRLMSRVDLNVLIHRARHDLVRAELDGAVLLDRAQGGSATRFRMARDARVSIE